MAKPQQMTKCHSNEAYWANGIKTWRIYVIHNTITKKWYVGQTTVGIRRVKSHFNRPSNPVIARDLRVHGLESFQYRFLEKEYSSQAHADLIETLEIVRRDTLFPRGYNFQLEIRSDFKVELFAHLEQVFDKSRDFSDKGKMLEASCV